MDTPLTADQGMSHRSFSLLRGHRTGASLRVVVAHRNHYGLLLRLAIHPARPLATA